MNLMVKVCSALPSFEIVAIRAIFGAVGCMVYLSIYRIPLFGPPEHRKLLVTRGCFGFIGLSCTYYSLTVLPLSDATVLSFLSPVFTGILARILLKERFGLPDILCTILSLMGVVFIARPEFIFGGHSTSNDEVIEPLKRMVAVAISILGAVAAGFAYVTVRTIGSGVHPLVLVNYLSMISTVLATICCFAFPSQRAAAAVPPLWMLAPLFAACSTALLGQVCWVVCLGCGLYLQRYAGTPQQRPANRKGREGGQHELPPDHLLAHV
eukprot:TRINITY_DN9140_c0_g1_i3.p1 TRINITY_DN9140_c0_g1~~TRINITY_DN9140_c0_g1_i3.p1  ORF type:complete len:267 (-),score=28.37 TRINITY_DN9140_c0_g1_i3:72-872(-)